MRCPACTTTVSPHGTTPLCPACVAVAGLNPPLPTRARPDVTWLWVSPAARAAVASGDLGVILRAYRTATATSQRRLAEHLGYDTTYISMIETGRRDITDVATLARIADRLGIPARVLGVSEPDDADFVAMLQFAEATLRLAVLARQSGHGTVAVNELWPVAARLEARVAAGRTEPDVLHLLARVRAELGVCLGYVLPEQRLAHAARWTWRALMIAQHLDDPHLHAQVLRAHGNELRKTGHLAAATARLYHALHLSGDTAERHATLMQLARATGEQGDATTFDEVISQARRTTVIAAGGLGSAVAFHETQLRGLLQTGRAQKARRLLDQPGTVPGGVPPQWRVMIGITIAAIHITTGDTTAAHTTLLPAIIDAETHRLPHQLQRAQRCATALPDANDQCLAALARITPSHALHPPRRR